MKFVGNVLKEMSREIERKKREFFEQSLIRKHQDQQRRHREIE